MIGVLPKTLNVDGIDYEIRSDFRVVLNVFEAFNDTELSDKEKVYICLRCIYKDFNSIPAEDIQEAIEKAFWFCDGGDIPKSKPQKVKTFDWRKDENLLFPAINKVAGYEVRLCDYMHWWTFLGMFGEIGEGRFTVIMNIRQKKAQGKPLDKWERDIYKDNKELIDIISEEDEQALKEDEAFLNELLGLKK